MNTVRFLGFGFFEGGYQEISLKNQSTNKLALGKECVM
jgi:hypothetical protein